MIRVAQALPQCPYGRSLDILRQTTAPILGAGTGAAPFAILYQEAHAPGGLACVPIGPASACLLRRPGAYLFQLDAYPIGASAEGRLLGCGVRRVADAGG